MLRIFAFVAILIVAGAGWFFYSKGRVAQVAPDASSSAQAGAGQTLGTATQTSSGDAEKLWDQADDARRSALQIGDQPGLRGDMSSANVERVEGILRREETYVATLDSAATKACTAESAAIDAFGIRYGAPAVSGARTDLAAVLTEIHNESRHWDAALDAMLDATKPALTPGSYYANDTDSASIKADFLAAEQSGENANAARDTLQSDFDALNAKLKTTSGSSAPDTTTSP